METDKIKSTIKKMENVFLKAGFEWQIINDERYLVYRENFCQITYVHGLSAYVIEATNNRREAENGVLEDGELYPDDIVPFPVSWTVKMKKKQKETQDILSYHTQAAGCSDKARAKASGGRQPIEECGRTGL